MRRVNPKRRGLRIKVGNIGVHGPSLLGVVWQTTHTNVFYRCQPSPLPHDSQLSLIFLLVSFFIEEPRNYLQNGGSYFSTVDTGHNQIVGEAPRPRAASIRGRLAAAAF